MKARMLQRRLRWSGNALLFVAVLAMLIVVGQASADTIFSDEASFLSAAGTLSFESFELLPVDNAENHNTIAVTDFTVTTPGVDLGIWDSNPFGSHATDGVQFLGWTARLTGPTVAFTFDTPISAFGLTLTDAMDGGSGLSLSLSTDGGSNFPNFLTGLQANANEHFVGIITDVSFTQATITLSSTVDDGIGLDGVHYSATAVPEPSTLLLLGTGLIGLVGYGSRKRRA